MRLKVESSKLIELGSLTSPSVNKDYETWVRIPLGAKREFMKVTAFACPGQHISRSEGGSVDISYCHSSTPRKASACG